MEKKEYWICPECDSKVDINKKECWRCRFATDDVSKYKYNMKADLKSNLKTMSIIFTFFIAFIVVVLLLISSADRHYAEEQARIAMEEELQVRAIKERIKEREEQSKQWGREHKKRLQNEQVEKTRQKRQKISNLENQYENLLTEYGYVNGAYEKVQIRKRLEGILNSINYIVAGEIYLSNKKVNNVEAKVYNDIIRRYGHM